MTYEEQLLTALKVSTGLIEALIAELDEDPCEISIEGFDDAGLPCANTSAADLLELNHELLNGPIA